MDLNQHPLIHTYIQNNRFGDLLGMQFSILAPGKLAMNISQRLLRRMAVLYQDY